MKFIKYFILTVLSLILILILADMYICYSAPKTREEAKCAFGIERYNSLLEYKVFTEEKRDKINYEILQSHMHTYNKECKEFNKIEDILIDKLFDKAIKNLKK